MGVSAFNFENIKEITSILPEDPKLKSGDMQPLSEPIQSKNYGKEITWDDFTFRGEKIVNQVEELKNFIEFRKTNDKTLLSHTIESITQDQFDLVEVEINEKGLVKIGNQIFGLDSIKTLLAVASISNYRLKFTIDTAIPNFRFINRKTESANTNRISLRGRYSTQCQFRQAAQRSLTDTFLGADRCFGWLGCDDVSCYTRQDTFYHGRYRGHRRDWPGCDT